MTVLLEYIDLNEYNNYSLKYPFLLKCNDNLYTIIFLNCLQSLTIREDI